MVWVFYRNNLVITSFIMENTSNDGQQSLMLPSKRRRSTFFERRNSIVPQPINKNLNKSIVDSKHNDHLSSYYEKLLAEKEQWKTEAKNRLDAYHDINAQYKVAAKSSSKSTECYSLLTKEDVKKLKKHKPNMPKFLETVTKLHHSVELTQEFLKRAMELENEAMSQCDEELENFKDFIFNNSFIE